MKFRILLVVGLLWSAGLFSQQLHTENNAANVNNESNNTSGWYGGADISSVSTNPYQGNFCIRTELSSSGGRDIRYTFSATPGEEYNIVIWARLGQGVKPAFANWQGFQGFSTTQINSSQWTEYNFTLTATSNNPEIRVYVGSAKNSSSGDHIFLDFVSITSTSFSDSENPSAIDDLSSSSITESSLSLNWSEPSDNVGVVNYEVFQNNSSIGFTNNTFLNVNNGLLPDTSYSFHVVAIDAAGNRSSNSNTETLQTLPDGSAPNPVDDLSSSSLTFNSVVLNWTDPGDNVGVVDYEVFQGLNSLGLTGGATTRNVSSLSPNSSFDFTVIAIDDAGNRSGASNVLTVNTPEAPDSQSPDSVDDLLASNVSYTSVSLDWSTPADNVGVTQFEIFQNGSLLTSTVGNSFNVTNLIPGTNYSFYVIALDAVNNRSGNSNSQDITTLADNQDPSDITDLNASNATMTSVDLSWTPASDNLEVTGYDIYRNAALVQSDVQITAITDNGLAADTEYSYYVVAKDAAGNSSQSNTVTIRTLDAQNYNSSNANLNTVDWIARDLYADRNLGIGTMNTQGFRLAVAGNVVAEEIKVALQSNWPDYVFEKEYPLPTLEEVEIYIQKNGHLKNIPKQEEVAENGIMLGEMNANLLEKIEELTLYLIAQEKRINKLEKQNIELQKVVKKLDDSDN